MLSMFHARPQSMLLSVKPAAEAVKSHRVEKTRVSHPDSGIITISAIRYEVWTQPTSSRDADRPPPMSCSDDATIWMSRSAMNIPTHHHEGKDVAQRLGEGLHRRYLPLGVVSTETVVDRPGRRVPSRASESSKVIRTGTRWTILVKFPVAFSGGITLKIAPVPGAMLST
jgi:hypothetical protein